MALVLGEEVGDVVAERVGPLGPPGARVAGEHAASDRIAGTRRPDRVEHRHAEAVGVAAWCRPAADWAQLVAARGDDNIHVSAGRGGVACCCGLFVPLVDRRIVRAYKAGSSAERPAA